MDWKSKKAKLFIALLAILAFGGLVIYHIHSQSGLGQTNLGITQKTSPSTTATTTPTQAVTPEVVNMPSSFTVTPGETASITAGTYASSNCSIIVNYLSGPSQAQGLSPQLADSSGQVKWTWIVGTNTTPGTWPIDVSCSLNGQTGSGTTNMTVVSQMTQSQADAAANNLDQQINDYYSNMGQ